MIRRVMAATAEEPAAAVVVEERVENEAERMLCETYGPRIRSYGLRHLRNVSAAQDLVQQVLLAVLRALRQGTIADRERLDAYVLGTCRNAVMDMRRSDIRQRQLAEHASRDLPEGYEPDWSGVDTRRLEHCLRGLEPRDRAVVLATFVDDRGADEIGQAMDLSPGNVRVIRHRTLVRLQACVEGTAP